MGTTYDIAILGGGISGFSAALRLQSKGFTTIVLEQHGQPGGCAGYFSKKGFSFDVGATTLVDFTEGGIGGDFLKDIGLALPEGDYLDYTAWLPDREVTLYRDPEKWKTERENKLGATPAHKKFWALLDTVTDVFWKASRKNINMPFKNAKDALKAVRAIGIHNLYLLRYLNFTMLDVLKKFGLENDVALKGLLSILIEDTVHSSIDKAPFINAALGTTIRGAGLMRPKGGMKQFWAGLLQHYTGMGGIFKRGHTVTGFEKKSGQWDITTGKGLYSARKIINTLPVNLLSAIAPDIIQNKLHRFIEKNEPHQGSAIVVFLGVAETEVAGDQLTHHQILTDYAQQLGNGNNMFISVSSPGDMLSAPAGYRAVMISTHCGLREWQGLSATEYEEKKEKAGRHLIENARKVYPLLGKNPVVYETGTPLTYQKYTKRRGGSTGGYKQTLKNSNFKAIPHDIGVSDFWLAGDTTWPGLGTVACLISGRIASGYAAK